MEKDRGKKKATEEEIVRKKKLHVRTEKIREDRVETVERQKGNTSMATVKRTRKAPRYLNTSNTLWATPQSMSKLDS